MKNQTVLLTLTSAFLLIPFGRFVSRTFTNFEKNELKQIERSKVVTFDNSLRNFHPNKGE